MADIGERGCRVVVERLRVLILAKDRDVRREMRSMYREVVAAFREASRQLRRGTLDAVFPEWCLPPHGPMRGPPFDPVAAALAWL